MIALALQSSAQAATVTNFEDQWFDRSSALAFARIRSMLDSAGDEPA